jgi:lipid-binding SYLF domain-containing protein
MANRTFRVSYGRIPALAATMLLMTLSLLPAWGADKTKDEETIGNATNVLTAMLSGGAVPGDVLAKADCVLVVPKLKKGGFVVGGHGGRGPMSCRSGDKWSPPAMYTASGMSVGLQAGGSSSDFVLLLMNKKAVDAFLKGKTKLGRDASVAAGPGATAANLGGDVLTYARTSGAFAGLSLGGVTFEPDNSANQRLYGKTIGASEIVQGNGQATPAGQSFIDLLNSKVTAHAQ